MRYGCPRCGREVEMPEGEYYCKVCGPEARLIQSKKNPIRWEYVLARIHAIQECADRIKEHLALAEEYAVKKDIPGSLRAMAMTATDLEAALHSAKKNLEELYPKY